MAEGRPDAATLVGFFAMVVFIGLNFIAVRVSNHELDPFWGAALRYVAAALLLVGYMLVRRARWPRGRALRASVLYGTLNFAVFYALAYWALVELPAGIASVILAAVPLLTFLMAVGVRLEGFTWHALVGGVVVIVGVGVVAAAGAELDVPPMRFLAFLGAAVSIAAAGIVVKRAPRTDPFAMNAVGMTVGAVELLLVTLVAGDAVAWPHQAGVQAAVVYLILSSIALFVLMVWIIGRWTASGVAYSTVLSPIVTIVVAHLLLDEPVTWRFLAGGALILLGVYWGALRHKRSPVAAPAPLVPEDVPAARR